MLILVVDMFNVINGLVRFMVLEVLKKLKLNAGVEVVKFITRPSVTI